jgi:hypothetical protein
MDKKNGLGVVAKQDTLTLVKMERDQQLMSKPLI